MIMFQSEDDSPAGVAVVTADPAEPHTQECGLSSQSGEDGRRVPGLGLRLDEAAAAAQQLRTFTSGGNGPKSNISSTEEDLPNSPGSAQPRLRPPGTSLVVGNLSFRGEAHLSR